MKYLKLIRFQNLVVIVLIQYLIRFTLIIPRYGKENVLSDFYFALILFSILLILAAGYTINDYFDIKVDLENKDAYVIVGRTRSFQLFGSAHGKPVKSSLVPQSEP